MKHTRPNNLPNPESEETFVISSFRNFYIELANPFLEKTANEGYSILECWG